MIKVTRFVDTGVTEGDTTTLYDGRIIIIVYVIGELS